MKPLAKGTPVIYKTKIFEGEGKVQPIAKENGYYIFNAFVSGDTDELGLSIVALDDPEICLSIVRKGGYQLEQTREEIFNTGMFIIDERTGWVTPSCPY